MGEEQFKELRRSMNPTAPVERTMFPAVRVKLWHVPVLELPASGRVMNGATLIVIRPAERTMKWRVRMKVWEIVLRGRGRRGFEGSCERDAEGEEALQD
ncbi:hypothetical protein CK203_080119 [Vitis vinifera]|uniref:Uncharacterized protein n=1 Tax=Vitis vinifera TaxID=29760 RepID=A0A438F2M4_VITVI|nr:hypothetical protein CK203_080119 [Vitis vinifera]